MGRSSSSPDVVYHLTWAYSLNNVSSPHFHRLGEECSGESQYLYMPLANGWDCYKHETFDRIDGWFRSPCTCNEPQPERLRQAALFGVGAGLAAFLVNFALGGLLHGKTRRRSSMIACALLFLAQQIFLLLVLYHLHQEGFAIPEAFLASCMLASLAATAIFTLSPAPLFIAIPGDVVSTPRGLVRITSTAPSEDAYSSRAVATPGSRALEYESIPSPSTGAWGPPFSAGVHSPAAARGSGVPSPLVRVMRSPTNEPGSEETIPADDLQTYTPKGETALRGKLTGLLAATGLLTPVEGLVSLAPTSAVRCCLSEHEAEQRAERAALSGAVARGGGSGHAVEGESRLYAPICFVQATFGSAPPLFFLSVLLANEGFHRVVHNIGLNRGEVILANRLDVLTVSVAAALCFFNSIAASVGLLFSSASKDHNVVRHELIAHPGTLVGITGYLISDMALRVAAVATLGSALDEYAIEAALAVWGGAVGLTFVARTFQHGPGACQSAGEGGDLVSGAVGLAYAGLRAWLDAMVRGTMALMAPAMFPYYPASALVLDAVGSTAGFVAVGYAGLSDNLPDPHFDPSFQYNAVLLLLALATWKLLAFAFVFLDAVSGRSLIKKGAAQRTELF
mmetsp:Transcript_30913/g.96820  ORF Transcript_30913/g.96820 Transcript_30913/m.96820 type:complete len:623 (+) Transcript_30913:277-2145(+)